MIYLDHASTTPLDPRVAAEMETLWGECFHNASSPYAAGRKAKEIKEAARQKAAMAIGAHAEEIIFGSGGTEADNLAIKGAAWALEKQNGRKGRIMTSNAEHHAVLSACHWLEELGFPLSVLPVGTDGTVKPALLEAALAEHPDTVLVSLMWVNNEIGAVNPVKTLAETAHRHNALFHTDAVQAAAALPIDVTTTGVDYLSLSAHKLYGPKGTGLLYRREGAPLEALLHGGQQEYFLRGGTENVAGIAALGKALELAKAEMPARQAHVERLKRRLLAGLGGLDGWRINGGGHKNDSPAILNLGFAGLDSAEGLVLLCDHAGVQLSMGAACNSQSVEPSHVLSAIGVPPEMLNSSVRVSFGQGNTPEDIDTAAEVMIQNVTRLRRA